MLFASLSTQGCVAKVEFYLPRARKPMPVGFPAELESLSDHISLLFTPQSIIFLSLLKTAYPNPVEEG